MSRFVPTLPQWPCHGCGKRITKHRAYVVACYSGGGVRDVIGIQRKVNGAYCVACAIKESHTLQEHPHENP
jgi:NMD protein affecting ribosome stability and mRNA decay